MDDSQVDASVEGQREEKYLKRYVNLEDLVECDSREA